MSNMSLENKVAVVTGAGSGIGKACALALSKKGVKIAILGRRIEPLKETSSIIRNHRGEVIYESVDVTNRIKLSEFVKNVLQKYYTIDILVNAAGLNIKRRFLENMDPGDWERVIGTNLTGVYNCVQEILPIMRKNKEGVIVNIGSNAGRWVDKGSGIAYVASKHALYSFNQSINLEEWKNGIRACSILPGEVRTPLVFERLTLPDEHHLSIMLRPEDVAESVIFAVSQPKHLLVEEIVLKPTNRESP